MLWTAQIVVEILGYALLLQAAFGIPLLVGPTIYAGTIILVLYVADFVHALKFTSQLFHLVGILAFPIFAFINLRESISSWTSRRAVADGVLKIVVVGAALSTTVVVLFQMNAGGFFVSTDEFSHWGTVIRAISEADTFHLQPNPLLFQDYPPGSALFSYHVLNLLGYTEGHAFFSYALLLLCFASCVFAAAIRVGIVAFLVTLGIVILSVSRFGPGWSSVLIDHVLGAAFGACIATYYVLRADARGLFAVPVMLSALVLIKHAGLMLGLLAAGICIVDCVILRRFRLNREDLIWSGAMLAAPVATALSWRAYVSFGGLRTSWIDYSPFATLNNFFACCTSSREVEVANKFFPRFLDLQPSTLTGGSLYSFVTDALSRTSYENFFTFQNKLSLGLVLVMLITGSLILALAHWKNHLRTLWLAVALLVGGIGYSATLLMAYLYALSEYEGRVLISFERYHYVFVLAWLLVLVTMTCIIAGRFYWPLRFVLSLAAAYALLLARTPIAGPPNPILSYNEFIAFNTPKKEPYRRVVGDWAERVRPKLPKDAMVFLIWQQSNGLEVLVAKYELLPRLTNRRCWGLGVSDDPAESYLCKPIESEMRKQIAPYAYVAVGNGVKYLREHFPTLFAEGPPDTEEGVFRIEKSGENIRLHWVP